MKGRGGLNGLLWIGLRWAAYMGFWDELRWLETRTPVRNTGLGCSIQIIIMGKYKSKSCFFFI